MTYTPHIYHQPVLLRETLSALNVRPGGRYIDATVGEGGHAQAILEASAPEGQLLGIDADHLPLATASQRLRPYTGRFVLKQENFAHLEHIALAHRFASVQGILFDLGLSSLHLEGTGRGFSFRREEPLDMRFSLDQRVTAEDILNTYPLQELTRLIGHFGEEPRARRIARAVVQCRPLHTTRELADLVRRASGYRGGRTHPATRTFQALRIAVNDELGNLEKGLEQAVPLLEKGGRLVVISFHSLEDRIVKGFFRQEKDSTLHLVTGKVVKTSQQEVQENSRSRSARLRAAERL